MSLTEQIKELRSITGAGFMDCKAALVESEHDLEKAQIILRKKGLLDAGKKASRDASQGIVSIFSKNNKTILLELKCETDFVARNPDFLSLALDFAKESYEKNIDDGEKLSKIDAISEKLALAISKIGENIKLGQIRIIDCENLFYYIHDKRDNNSGSIISCVCLDYDKSKITDLDLVSELGKKLAMQVAAAKPRWLDPSSVDAKTIDVEKSVYTDQFKNSGKEDKIIEKMVLGKLNKFYQQNCLIKQQSIHDSTKTVDKLILDVSSDIKVKLFERISVLE